MTGADDRLDDPGFAIHSPDAIAAGITDVEIVLRIERDAQREVESGLAADPSVTAVARLADPGEVMDGAFLQIDPPDAIGAGLGDIEKSFEPIQRHVGW